MKIVAHFHSPFGSKFGVPRQSGLAPHLSGRVVFEPDFRSDDAIRGLEGFEYLWLLWGFSGNRNTSGSLLVRPPRLGGNRKVGVFASRSPFRPNAIGLSSVRLTGVKRGTKLSPILCVEGADLMHGTPIYDIKPYLPYTDAHPGARAGWADEQPWQRLDVTMPSDVRGMLNDDEINALTETLALDPRPQYHDDSLKTYGLLFNGLDIHFTVDGTKLIVTDAKKIAKK